MSDQKWYSAQEVKDILTWFFPHLPVTIDTVLLDLAALKAAPREEDSYEPEAVYADAHGTHWQFFPRGFCEEGDPPVWNTIGDANTYDFDVPARPLLKVSPTGQSEQDYATLFAKLDYIIGQYDEHQDRNDPDELLAYAVVGKVRAIVEGCNYGD